MGYKLEKNISDQLKGFAIFFVLLGHLTAMGYIETQYYPIKLSGIWGVSIFLILSGYGLTQSYFKNGINFTFFIKRIRKVLVPYMTITVVWLLIDVLYYHKFYSVVMVMKSLFSLDFTYTIDPTMWYITFIFIWYIAFFLIFVLPVKNIIKVTLIFVVAVLFKKWGYFLVYDWQYYYFSFPLGILISYALSKQVRIKRKINSLAILIPLWVVTFGLFLHYIVTVVNYTQVDTLSFSGAMLTIAIAVTLIIYKFKSKLLTALGMISFEVYLIEGKILFVNRLLETSDNMLVNVFDFFVYTILYAYLLSKLIKIINLGIDRIILRLKQNKIKNTTSLSS